MNINRRFYRRCFLWAFFVLLPLIGHAKEIKQTNFVQHLGQFSVGDDLPRMILQDQDGNFAFNQNFTYGEKGTVFTFFQTTCAPCLVGLMELVKASKRFEISGVHIIAVHIREPNKGGGDLSVKDVQGWLKTQKLSDLTTLYDPTGALMRVGLIAHDGTVTLPVTLALGPNRKVVALAREEGGDYISGLLERVRRGASVGGGVVTDGQPIASPKSQ